tara:strand:+ start:1820 stop:3301 length:1482 start_codon:yes stop_codon:yes gene_type:complete
MELKKRYYKKYFSILVNFLNKIDFTFLYYIPGLFLRDFRNNHDKSKKISVNFFRGIFDKDIIIKKNELLKSSSICFISHYVGAINNKDLDHDFYFGNLFKILNKKNFKFSIILINHTDEKITDIYKKFNKSNLNRIILNDNLNIIRDFKILFYILFKFVEFKLIKSRKYYIFKKSKHFKVNLNLKAFLSASNTIKLTDNIKSILGNMSDLKNLFATYEGHPFERIIFNYCKKNQIKSFGYFFSVIREFQNSIYFNINKNFSPDVIFTSGNLISKNLKKYVKYKNDKIITLGSPRKLKKKNSKFYKSKNIKKLKVLVCPEGLYSETKLMLNLVREISLKKNNKIEYIFRTHPVIDKSVLKNEIYTNPNIKFSKNKDILKDFANCNVVLYSGSSVCIQAVLNGLLPIYYHKKNSIFSIDPLFEINRFVIKNRLDLEKILNNLILNKENTRVKIRLKKIQKYCLEYFSKINLNSLIQNLKNENKFKLSLKENNYKS